MKGTTALPRNPFNFGRPFAFTLIELLVVISIISLLISILMPSLGRARDQAKGVHCLARLKDMGTGLATYENVYGGVLPPALWNPEPSEIEKPMTPQPIQFGWTELLWTHLFQEPVRLAENFPVQRNIEGRRWENYFVCKSAGEEGASSGHYRVYLPSWSAGSFVLDKNGRYDETARANPRKAAHRERMRLRVPILGDANEDSERGDGIGEDDCSYIDAGEANDAGYGGRRNGNRFSDRHYGGTNYLFPDLHATWSAGLRNELARDFDLNGVLDIDEAP